MLLYDHLIQIIITAVVLIATPVSRLVTAKIIRRYASITKKADSRTKHIVKVFSILINIAALLIVIIVWGVDPRNLLVAISSIFAVIGVAFFAQWSLLSNVTAGILIYFSTPFRIGDFIRIHDKEFPIDAEVVDILAFHTHLKTSEGEIVIIPNSLLLQRGISVINPNEE
ncbi:mechanosensitive ion channel family protein [Dysgonomonas sp. 216]|uniref:mechanosensitive ion channel family protein n=1 Tax=Dysgonomonas sp. 216 TaxID=2302934 RepID=UPI0016242A63|nr:mechanosensitive ion channel domain-containing protein [Dysgonomonas sp. 216]